MTQLLQTESRYQFVPPHTGKLWPRLLSCLVPLHLRHSFGVQRVETGCVEKLRALQQAGHGVLIAPNHCRMSDALVLQSLSAKLGQPFHVMASSHLFRGSRLQSFVLRRMGAFSIYREGIDRAAVDQAVEILSSASRPLVIFPEGALSQANDSLNALQEGVSFIARTAAARCRRQQESSGRQVFVVPVAIRYVFEGDIESTADSLLRSIEQRLSWKPLSGLPLTERVVRVGGALLALKELEYLGRAQTGGLEQRLQRLIDHLLVPAEVQWLKGARTGSVIARVRDLRRAILPDMIDGQLPAAELERRWAQLKHAELAQSLSLYPPDYVASNPTVDRILETIERFNEHLNGTESRVGPRRAVIEVGEPIAASATRDRSAETDPLLASLELQLRGLLHQTSVHCRRYQPGVLGA
jgi:1-acyl-sn-glycerol-3-phosphate acyltransferase